MIAIHAGEISIFAGKKTSHAAWKTFRAGQKFGFIPLQTRVLLNKPDKHGAKFGRRMNRINST